MYPQQKNDVKVKVAVRKQTVPNQAALVGSVLLLVVLLIVVLIGRPAGFM